MNAKVLQKRKLQKKQEKHVKYLIRRYYARVSALCKKAKVFDIFLYGRSFEFTVEAEISKADFVCKRQSPPHDIIATGTLEEMEEFINRYWDIKVFA